MSQLGVDLDDERRIAVIDFFKKIVPKKFAEAKSTPTSLIGILGRNAEPRLRLWFREKYQENNVQFFYDNSEHFEYDEELGLIKLTYSPPNSQKMSQSVKTLMKELTDAVVADKDVDPFEQFVDDGEIDFPIDDTISIGNIASGSESGASIHHRNTEATSSESVKSSGDFLSEALGVLAAQQSVNSTDELLQQIDVFTKQKRRAEEALNSLKDKMEKNAEQQNKTKLSPDAMAEQLNSNLARSIRELRDYKKKLSEAKTQNFRLNMQIESKANEIDFFVQLFMKFSTDEKFVHIMVASDEFDQLMKYCTSMLANSIGFGDGETKVTSALLTQISMLLTNIAFFDDGRQAMISWSEFSNLLDIAKFMLLENGKLMTPNTRLYLLMAVFNLTIDQIGFEMLSEKPGWIAILASIADNDDGDEKTRRTSLKLLTSLALSKNQKNAQEISTLFPPSKLDFFVQGGFSDAEDLAKALEGLL